MTEEIDETEENEMKAARCVVARVAVLTALALAVLLLPASGSGPASASRPEHAQQTAASGPYYVVTKTRNDCGRMEYLRRGGPNSFGYRKMALKHNIKKPAVWKAVIHKTCGNQQDESTTYRYQRTILKKDCVGTTCTTTDSVLVLVVQQRNNNKGAITAYCLGRTRCPNWLNTLVLVESRPASERPRTGSWMMLR